MSWEKEKDEVRDQLMSMGMARASAVETSEAVVRLAVDLALATGTGISGPLASLIHAITSSGKEFKRGKK